jgi:hypothetical protein
VEGATDDEALLPLIFCLCCFHTSQFPKRLPTKSDGLQGRPVRIW